MEGKFLVVALPKALLPAILMYISSYPMIASLRQMSEESRPPRRRRVTNPAMIYSAVYEIPHTGVSK